MIITKACHQKCDKSGNDWDESAENGLDEGSDGAGVSPAREN
jgi:hypothetical protein